MRVPLGGLVIVLLLRSRRPAGRVDPSSNFSQLLRAVDPPFELIAHIERTPELRRTFVEASREARLGLAELFGNTGDERLGRIYQTLLLGAAAHWLVDPNMAPSGRDLSRLCAVLSLGVGGAAR